MEHLFSETVQQVFYFIIDVQIQEDVNIAAEMPEVVINEPPADVHEGT